MARNLEARLNSYRPVALSVFRVIYGLLFLCHGLSALIGWPRANHVAPVGQWPYWYAGLIETVAGVLISVGLFTRAAAFIAAGAMAFAYFTVHLPQGFFPINNDGEAAVMYCFAFLLLLFTGGGTYAVDARRGGWRLTGRSRRTLARRR
jgi:putative oxidoreductase